MAFKKLPVKIDFENRIYIFLIGKVLFPQNQRGGKHVRRLRRASKT